MGEMKLSANCENLKKIRMTSSIPTVYAWLPLFLNILLQQLVLKRKVSNIFQGTHVDSGVFKFFLIDFLFNELLQYKK